MKRKAAGAASAALASKPESAAFAGTIVPPQFRSQTPAIAWQIALGLLALLAWLYLWWPVERVPVQMEVNYNEGWNVYNQQRAADGVPLYGAAPRFFYTNYPPLSFHLIGLLGKAVGDLNGTGRWISLLSYLAIAILIGLMVHRLTGLRRAGAYAALMFAIFVPALREDRIGMNDPHLLGMAFGAIGLYCIVRDAAATWSLAISGAAFALSVFTKQSLVAIPAAVGIYLFFETRTAFWKWLIAAAASSVVLLGLTFAIDGRYFLEHMALPRTSDFADFGKHISKYVQLCIVALIGAILWCGEAKPRGQARLLVLMLALTNLIGVWFSTGAGVSENILFDALVALALVAGVAAPWAIWRIRAAPYGVAAATALLLAPFLTSAWLMVNGRYQEDSKVANVRPQLEGEYGGLVQLVRSQNGEALCESLLVCYDAGKPEVYDTYVLTQLLDTGKLRDADLVPLVEARRFAVVQTIVEAGIDPAAIQGHLRFSPAFMTALLANYRMVWSSPNFAAFVPKK